MKQIIAIQGLKASGKDETAKYLYYILNTPRIMHCYWLAKLFKFKPINSNWHIVRYAGKLKEILAILMNVPVTNFEDRNFKEHYYFDFVNFQLLHETKVDNKQKITAKLLNRELKKGNLTVALLYTLSIRQILQFFGTEIMRSFFGNQLWVQATLNSNHERLIIADQRFKIENEISKTKGAYVIHIKRDGCVVGLHSSEKELEELYQEKRYDVLLDNNGTLKDLFNKCKKIIYSYQN